MENRIPDGAEVTVLSVRWAVQSRAAEGGPWRVENDTTPGLPGPFEEAARKLLRIYRGFAGDRESRLALRTEACFDEPVEG